MGRPVDHRPGALLLGLALADDDRFYVKTLRMQNFRCFEGVDLGPFDPSFNLLVGENGTGKSSVLLAIAELYGHLANWVPPSLEKRLVRRNDTRLESKENHHLVVSMTKQAYFVLGSSANYRNLNLSSREVVYSDENKGDEFSIIRVENFNMYYAPNRTHDGKLLDEISPVIAFYRTGRSFVSQNQDAVGRARRGRIRDDAFHLWQDAGVAAADLREWFERETLASLQSVRRESQTGIKETRVLPIVHRALMGVIEDVTRIEFDADLDDLVVQFSDGKRRNFSDMSDGQRAYIGLVADLARRVALLNAPFSKLDALNETPGLVLIDEIDLHLHPKWQRQIVPALKKVFPKIQFFATSHSPQVIGSCQPEEIVVLTPDGQKRPGPSGSYGRDSNWVLECVMNADGRDPDVAKQIKSIWDAIEKGHFPKARGLIKKLRAKIGDDPDIIGAESYMWRIEHGDEAAE